MTHEAIAEYVPDVLQEHQWHTRVSPKCGSTTFWCLLWSITEQTHATWNLFVLYNNETNYYRKSFFSYFKIFQHNSKAGPNAKKPFDKVYCLCKMKQSHWLQCAAKKFDWPTKITSLSNLTRASRNKNLQGKQNWDGKSTNLKKMLDTLSQFLWSEQPSELKNLDVAWTLQEL